MVSFVRYYADSDICLSYSTTFRNNETDFLVLDGAMIVIATVCLTAIHPGVAFGGIWQAADWNFRGKKAAKSEEIPMVGSQGSRLPSY